MRRRKGGRRKEIKRVMESGCKQRQGVYSVFDLYFVLFVLSLWSFFKILLFIYFFKSAYVTSVPACISNMFAYTAAVVLASWLSMRAVGREKENAYTLKVK